MSIVVHKAHINLPTIFRNIVQIISANNNGSLHFVGDNQALQDTTTDGNVAGEGAPIIRF